jgi:hypothetical protein
LVVFSANYLQQVLKQQIEQLLPFGIAIFNEGEHVEKRQVNIYHFAVVFVVFHFRNFTLETGVIH